MKHPAKCFSWGLAGGIVGAIATAWALKPHEHKFENATWEIYRQNVLVDCGKEMHYDDATMMGEFFSASGTGKVRCQRYVSRPYSADLMETCSCGLRREIKSYRIDNTGRGN